MADLRVGDELPLRMQRVAVAGPSGCGKSTLARRIGAILDLPYTDLDSLYHGPERRAEMVAAVAAMTAGPRWVCEYQYPVVRRLIRERADVVVWLHLPRPVVLWRLLRRKLGRRLHRGRRAARDWPGWDRPLRRIVTDRRRIVYYTRASYAQDARAARNVVVRRRRRSRPERSQDALAVVRLYSTEEVRRWLERLEQRAATPARRAHTAVP